MCFARWLMLGSNITQKVSAVTAKTSMVLQYRSNFPGMEGIGGGSSQQRGPVCLMHSQYYLRLSDETFSLCPTPRKLRYFQASRTEIASRQGRRQ